MRYRLDVDAYELAFRQHVARESHRRHAALMDHAVEGELTVALNCNAGELHGWTRGEEPIPEMMLVRLADALTVEPKKLVRWRPALVELQDA